MMISVKIEQNNNERCWFVFGYEPGRLKSLIKSLTKRETEFYTVNRNNREMVDKIKVSFPKYIFVKIAQSELDEVSTLRGISHLIYWLNSPVVISNAEIDIIKRFYSDFRNVVSEKILVEPEKSPRFRFARYSNLTMKTISLNENIIRAELPSLGYALIATVKSKVNVRLEQYGSDILANSLLNISKQA